MRIKNIFKGIVRTTLIAALGIATLTGCGKKENNSNGNKIYRTVDEIKESGTVKIGVFSDKNPFGYVDEKGDYQ